MPEPAVGPPFDSDETFGARLMRESIEDNEARRAEERMEPPSDCDHDCDEGCSMTEFPVWMRPYRCRHLSAADRRARDIVIREVELG